MTEESREITESWTEMSDEEIEERLRHAASARC